MNFFMKVSDRNKLLWIISGTKFNLVYKHTRESICLNYSIFEFKPNQNENNNKTTAKQ